MNSLVAKCRTVSGSGLWREKRASAGAKAHAASSRHVAVPCLGLCELAALVQEEEVSIVANRGAIAGGGSTSVHSRDSFGCGSCIDAQITSLGDRLPLHVGCTIAGALRRVDHGQCTMSCQSIDHGQCTMVAVKPGTTYGRLRLTLRL